MQHLAVQLLQFSRSFRPTHRQRLARWSNYARGNRIERALRFLVKRTQRLNLITKKLYAHRARERWREEIDDTTTVAELTWFLHLRYRLIPKVIEMLQHQRKIDF